MKTAEDYKLVGEYISNLLAWINDDTMRGKKGIRAKIEKLGNELVKRNLLSEDDAKKFYEGDW